MKTAAPLIAAALLAAPAAAQDLCEGNGHGEAYLEVGPAYLGGFFVHDMGSPAVPNGILVFSISAGFATTVHPVIGAVCLDVTSPTRLDDGRVLVTGGMDSSGVCHATCELFDLTTGTMTPTGSMTTPRGGHVATLLDDGRVLVTGGFADYQNPTTAWKAALDTSQDTGEIYDPATGTWTPLAQTLLAKRSGHSATKLAGGRVLLVGGVTGGFDLVFSTTVAPTFTGTCEIFDPATDTLTPAATLLGGGLGARAFHGASVLGNGDVLVTGGNVSGGTNGEAVSTNSCVRWDGSAWHVAPALPVTVAWHNQMPLDDGRAFVCGGLSLSEFDLQPKAFAAAIDGSSYQPLSAVGLNEGLPGSGPLQRGAMEAVRMHDGAMLFTGGVDATSVLDEVFVYTPNP